MTKAGSKTKVASGGIRKKKVLPQPVVSSDRTITSHVFDVKVASSPKTDAARSVGERIGVKIVQVFKEQAAVRNEFSDLVRQVRNRYPTGNHVNKFIAGMAMEYLFCHVLRSKARPSLPIFLSSDSERRFDVKYAKQNASSNDFNGNLQIKISDSLSFSYSLKYKSPNPCSSQKTVSIPDIKLVNTLSEADQENVAVDLFLIVPNDAANDSKKGRLIFIPKEHMMGGGFNARGDAYNLKITKTGKGKTITYDPIYRVSDGYELSKFFVNYWLLDPANAKYWVEIDVPLDLKIRRLDPIAALLNEIVDLEKGMFKYRIMSNEPVPLSCVLGQNGEYAPSHGLNDGEDDDEIMPPVTPPVAKATSSRKRSAAASREENIEVMPQKRSAANQAANRNRRQRQRRGE